MSAMNKAADIVMARFSRPMALSTVLLDLVPGRSKPTLEQALTGKVVLITGASSGIGRAAAHKIAAAGGEVVLVARGADKLAEVVAEIEAAGGIAHAYPCDLSDLDACGALIEQVLADLGRVDILINNAGRSIRRSLAVSYDRIHDFQRTMQLNYFAAIRLGLGVLPGMRERKEGHIINISSIGVATRLPRFGAYIGSKAALEAVSDSWAGETVPDNVHITTIAMPLVRTPMSNATEMYKQMNALTPDEAADAICDAIVNRPPRMNSAIGSVAAVADHLAPHMMSVMRRRGFAAFDESVDPSGHAKTTADELTREAKMLAEVTRGMHW